MLACRDEQRGLQAVWVADILSRPWADTYHTYHTYRCPRRSSAHCTTILRSAGGRLTMTTSGESRYHAMHIRPATTDDAPAIAAIYNEGIRARTATFETRERAPDEVLAWLDGPFPLLVAERAGTAGALEVVGWVRASPYRARPCYAGIGDFSVYVAERARGARVGDALLGAFVDACTRAGAWKLVSRIFPENAASRALCRRHGFREVGTYARHARLDGAWRDVIIVERLIPENQG